MSAMQTCKKNTVLLRSDEKKKRLPVKVNEKETSFSRNQSLRGTKVDQPIAALRCVSLNHVQEASAKKTCRRRTIPEATP
jgi:hypothetical protein